MDRDLSGACGVCKNVLEGAELMVCADCRALYHRDCWLYNGGRCAAYGCPRAHGGRTPFPSLSGRRWTSDVPSDPEPEPEPVPAPGTPSAVVNSILAGAFGIFMLALGVLLVCVAFRARP